MMTPAGRFLTRVATLAVLALRAPPTSGTSHTNYMSESGVFASISNIEDLLHPEGEVMRRLEKYYERAGHTLASIKKYIEAWKALDYESLLGEDSPSKQQYFEKKRSILKQEELELSLILNKLKANTINDKKRGDDFSLTEENYEEQQSDNKTDAAKNNLKIIRIEKELELLRAEYSKYSASPRKNSTSVAARRSGGVEHPVDAYLLMRRLTKDWIQVQQDLLKLKNDTYETLVAWENDHEEYEFPIGADLNGAAVAMVRLQDLYDLDMSDFGDGHIPAAVTHSGKSIQSLGRLRTWDYILLGKEAIKQGYNTRAMQWFKTAVIKSEGEVLTEEENTIVTGLRATIEKYDSLSLEDNSKRMKNKKKSKKKKKGAPTTKEKNQYLPIKKVPLALEEEKVAHAKLCRGENLRSPLEESVLRCWLERLESPYLLLMPLRLEEVALEPRILLYRDFLTPKQTEFMIKTARTKLHGSVHGNMDGYDVSMIRVSMTGWLSEEKYPGGPLLKITRKIEAATRMNAVHRFDAEEFQVANYGIGGLYDVHFDVGVSHNSAMGDRLGTFLIYLSDVAAGGATVFPSLGVRVSPQRGTALFWYNLYDDGTHDGLLRHAACPVLHGSKWISTKWIHYNSQFRKRPCSVSPGVRYARP